MTVQERARVNTPDMIGELCKVGGKLLDAFPGQEEEAEAPAEKK